MAEEKEKKTKADDDVVEVSQEQQLNIVKEDIRNWRMRFDKKCREGVLPLDAYETLADPTGKEIPMAMTFYLLQYYETCLLWPPQSSFYHAEPDIDQDKGEPDKS